VLHEPIKTALNAVIREMGIGEVEIDLERPRNPSHGDVTCNIALVLSGKLGRPSRDIAVEIAASIEKDTAGIVSIEVAGPGFLNFRLSAVTAASILDEIVAKNEGFGREDTRKGAHVMVEFVSANPTGPLHLGHGRQAALGDALASLLEWTGWQVHREFYYNDAGTQIDKLAQSVRVRYLALFGRQEEIPEGGYHGEYINELAESLAEEFGDQFVLDESKKAVEQIRSFSVRCLREEQDSDLDDFGVHFDEYYLESSLHDNGRVNSTLEALKQTGFVYVHEGATWLKTTAFGDQKDRVMVRKNGLPTYFLPDVAYHMHKWTRGYERVINVQGSDHHGTVDRVRSGLQALGLPKGYPEYVLHQMVRVVRDGSEVKFSKRAGTSITLRELYTEVGTDVTRYFFQMRKPDAQMVFDLDAALDYSDKNPMYKIQYAHARMHSIFAKAQVMPEEIESGSADLSLLTEDYERQLINQLRDFPSVLTRAAENCAPHIVCEYLEQTASTANTWYHAGNPSRNPSLAVLVDDSKIRGARLVLARSLQIVLQNGLAILGITAPKRMMQEPANDGT
jgi:arginyl-tRNA synthetase